MEAELWLAGKVFADYLRNNNINFYGSMSDPANNQYVIFLINYRVVLRLWRRPETWLEITITDKDLNEVDRVKGPIAHIMSLIRITLSRCNNE